MPKYEQSIALSNIDGETALALAYQAMQNLNWNILFAGTDTLVGSIPKNWKTNGQQMICTTDAGQLTIRSEMVKGEMADIFGINKKNTGKFINAFEEIKDSTDTRNIENNKSAIHVLRETTIKIAEQQRAEAVEMNEAMNLSGSNLYITYSIIGINVLVFILMALNGAGIFEANSIVHIQWGSNYTPLTLSGDWWRLLSNIFIHFGIIHLAMNMYCLYIIGIYLEPMLGKSKYITAYVCTGILASMTSLWWHKEGVNSAGASGAIFGLYGLFLALLTSSLIPKAARQQLLQSIGIFVAYNLIYGMKSGVDNAAHVGGLVSGFIIGLIYVYGIKKEKGQQQKLTWIIPVILLLTAASAYGYLQQNKVSDSERANALNEIKAASYEDNEAFNKKLVEFDEMDKAIVEIVNDTSLTSEKLIMKIDDIGFPKLKQVELQINSTANYNISLASHEKATKLIRFIGLRKNELGLLKQMAATTERETLVPQLNDVRTKEQLLINELMKP